MFLVFSGLAYNSTSFQLLEFG